LHGTLASPNYRQLLSHWQESCKHYSDVDIQLLCTTWLWRMSCDHTSINQCSKSQLAIW